MTDDLNAAAAGTWQLGDLTVNRIGFGTKRIAGDGSLDIGSARDRDRTIRLLRRAVELGVNHFDTAAFYPSYGELGETDFTSLGWANTLVREAFAPYPDDLVIATKVGPTEEGLARPDQLRGLVEADLRALGRDQLDLVYLRQHGLDSIAERFGVLADLRDAGLIRHLGVSSIRLPHLAEARAIAPAAAVQNRYSVDFGRVNDEMLETCGKAGIAVPYFGLAGEGREGGGVAPNETVQTVADNQGATPAQVRIAWALSRGPHLLVIPGTGDPGQVAENVEAGGLSLSADELASLS